MQFIVFVLLLALSLAYGFAPTRLSVQRAPTQRSGSIKMMNHIDILAKMPTLLTALEEAKPDDYQYGACFYTPISSEYIFGMIGEALTNLLQCLFAVNDSHYQFHSCSSPNRPFFDLIQVL